MQSTPKQFISHSAILCFVILTIAGCASKVEVLYDTRTGKRLPKNQVAHISTVVQTKTYDQTEVIIRVMTVDGQKIPTKSDEIKVLPGRHTMSCYISHSRQPYSKEWIPSETKRPFFLEFSAVRGRRYKPAYVYGDLQSTRFGIWEFLDPSFSDLWFEDLVRNRANRTDGCIGCAPYIRMSLVGLEGGWNEVFGGHRTVGVQWEVTASEPTDHIDLRLYVHQASPPYEVLLKQFTIRPEYIGGVERFPTSMYFNPRRYDPTFPLNTTEEIYRTYEVRASVVDKLGRGSSIDCEQINLKYIPPPDYETEYTEYIEYEIGDYIIREPRLQANVNLSAWGTNLSLALLDDMEPFPPAGCSFYRPTDPSTMSHSDLPDNTIESRYYEYERDGVTRYATTFRPYELIIDGTVGSRLYFTNNDNISHRLISVYNPVYRETDTERNNGNDPHTIGGVPGLDFGAPGTDGRVDVAPGTTVEITVPPSESGDRHRIYRTWTLWDFVDNSGQVDSAGNIYDRTYSRRLKIRVWYLED